MEVVNSTGVLKAVNDVGDHVSVTPILWPAEMKTLEEWIASRTNAETSPHYLTALLQEISTKEKNQELKWIGIIDRLNWFNDVKDIEDAKKELEKIPDDQIHLLVRPISQYHWENSAASIVNLGVDKCITVVNELLMWLQD